MAYSKACTNLNCVDKFPPSATRWIPLAPHKNAERRLLEQQDILLAASEKRRMAFEESIQQQRRDFEAKEQRMLDHGRYHFLCKLMNDGIEKARQETNPAYTFEKFLDLPKELQIKIWSMAARSEAPKCHVILPLSYDIVDRSAKTILGQPTINGSSRILQARAFKEIPAVLQVCHLSRILAEEVYTRMRCHGKKSLRTWDSEGYFNTLYDTFYFAEHSWNSFKILTDILIKQNTSRPPRSKVQQDMDKFLRIRHLLIDFHIFAAAPFSIWAVFPNLAEITIVLYPWIQFERRRAIPEDKLKLVKAQIGTKFGNRSAWTLGAVSAALEDIKNKHPIWKVPKLEVLVRDLASDNDAIVQKRWTEDPAEYRRARMMEEEDLFDSDKEEDDNEDENSPWYKRARMHLKETISAAVIEDMKRYYQ